LPALAEHPSTTAAPRTADRAARVRRVKRGIVLLVVLACALCAAFGVIPASAATGPEQKPLIGAIRWDAWSPTNTTYPSHYVADDLYTKWTAREPKQGWSLYGDGVDTQALVDQEITWAADKGLDYWAYVWYPENPGELIGDLMKPYRAYQASAVKNRLKFAMIAQTWWVSSETNRPRWRSTYVPQFVEMFKDPQYVRVNGNRPVLFWFGTADLDDPEKGFGADWPSELRYLRDQTRGQLDANGKPLGDPLLVDVNHDVSEARANGLDGTASYGPSGAYPYGQPPCVGEKGRSWNAQAGLDISNLGPYDGLLTVPSLTAVNDPRPRMEDDSYPGFRDYAGWTQPPTYGQWEKHVQRLYDWTLANPSRTTSPGLLLVYAWNELDEGGAGIVPTKQDGFLYLDGIQAVKTGRYPGVHHDVHNNDNCAISFSGSGWVRYPGVQTARDNDLQISWTAGDSASLAVDSVTEFVVRFNKGPDRGMVGISIDGGPARPVNLYSPTYAWFDYSTGALAPGRHTLRLVVRPDRDARSSGNQVPMDLVRTQVRRTVSWEFSDSLEGWSPDYQASASVSGGVLRVTASGTDTQLYNPSFGSSAGLGLTAAANRYVQVRMRNNTASTQAALYFLTDSDRTWGGTKAVSFPIAPSSDFTTYVVDVGAVASWKGTIRALRLDPGEPSVADGRYDLDWIRTTS
jgi:hypothetical protein